MHNVYYYPFLSFIYTFDIYGDCSNYRATFWGKVTEKHKQKDDIYLQDFHAANAEKETGFISQ